MQLQRYDKVKLPEWTKLTFTVKITRIISL